MTFVTAWLAVAGAAAMAIPIIIHLLSRQRRKPIEWAAMRFLIEAFRKHRKRLRIEQLLLLATRCLILLLLGTALARPLLQQAGILDHGAGRVIYFVIDDGLISGLTDPGGRSALERHVESANRIIDTLDSSDRVGVISAARPAQAQLVPPSSDHRAIVRLLQSLSPTDAPTDLPTALRLLNRALETQDHEHDHVYAVLLSEFRAGSADLEETLPALEELAGNQRIKLFALSPNETQIENIQVAAIEPVRHVIAPGLADGSDQITVRLERSGGALDTQISRVRMEADGAAQIEPRTVRWEPGQSSATVSFRVNFSPLFRGQREREVMLKALIDDDALNADNARHAVIELRPQIRVTILDRRRFGAEPTLERFSASQWIQRSLEPLDRDTAQAERSIQVVQVDPAALSQSDVRTADVLVAPRPDLITADGWTLLRQFVDGGGLLMLSPPSEQNLHQWAERLTTAMNLPWRVHLEVDVAATDVEQGGFFLASDQPRSEMLRLLAGDLDDLAQPVVAFRRLRIDREQTSATTLLAFADGQPLLMAGSPEKANDEFPSEARGMVVLLTAAPELSWTNLPSKPLMVPLMQEMTRQGLSMIRGTERFTAGEQPIVARGGAVRELLDPEQQRIVIDENGRADRPLSAAGRYELRDSAGQRVRSLVVNIEPESGRAETQPASAVMNWLGTSGDWAMLEAGELPAAVRAGHGGAPLAGILLALLLALILTETVLARWFSHAFREEEQPRKSAIAGRLSGSETHHAMGAHA